MFFNRDSDRWQRCSDARRKGIDAFERMFAKKAVVTTIAMTPWAATMLNGVLGLLCTLAFALVGALLRPDVVDDLYAWALNPTLEPICVGCEKRVLLLPRPDGPVDASTTS